MKGSEDIKRLKHQTLLDCAGGAWRVCRALVFGAPPDRDALPSRLGGGSLRLRAGRRTPGRRRGMVYRRGVYWGLSGLNDEGLSEGGERPAGLVVSQASGGFRGLGAQLA